MLYAELIRENKDVFLEEVKKISAALGIRPEWLMQVMKIESGLNHKAVNPHTNATGLIQFMPKTAVGLGTTVDQLKYMSNASQLYYVYKYLLPYKNRIKSYVDLYLTIFFPIAVGKPQNWVLETKNLAAGTIAKVNPGWDLNKDMKITVGEIQEAILKKVPPAYLSVFTEKKK